MTQSQNLTLALLLICLPSSIVVAQQNQEEKNEQQPHFQSGVIVDGDLLAIDNEGHLVRLNATWGGKRDYGTFERDLSPHVAVTGDKAYVSSSDEICEVDLTSGSVTRSATHGLGQARVGVIDDRRVFVQNGAQVEIIDLDSNETIYSIELGEASLRKLFEFSTRPHALNGDLLYIALSDGGVIAEVDVNRGNIVRRIDTHFHWVTGLHVAGRKLYASQLTSSYGIIRESLTAYDLESLQPNRIEIPPSRVDARDRLIVDNETYVPIAMVSQADGGFSLAVGHGVFQFDADGNVVAKSDALQGCQRLIAATTDEVIVSTADGCQANTPSAFETTAK